MVIQAYIDDSMTEDEVLVMAGYIADAETWAKFSDEWQERLDMRPRWPYFKMAEIGLSKDKGRWERAGWFYRVIENHARAFVAVVVEVQALRAVVRELNLPGLVEDPYVMAHRAILDFTIQYQHELGIAEPIEFIFDEHGQKDAILRGFEVYKEFLTPELKVRVDRPPRFERDTDFLPLQAADLLAWHVRRHWLAHKSVNADIEISWPSKKAIPGYKFLLNYDDLLRNLRRLRKRLEQVGLLPSGELSITVTFSGLDGRKF